MIPVPPPKILELGTAVALTPLKVTLVMLALVDELFSHATPMITIRSVPLPSVWDQEGDEIEVVDAVRLAALNEMAAQADGVMLPSATANPTASTRSRKNRTTDRLPVPDILPPNEWCALKQAVRVGAQRWRHREVLAPCCPEAGGRGVLRASFSSTARAV